MFRSSYFSKFDAQVLNCQVLKWRNPICARNWFSARKSFRLSLPTVSIQRCLNNQRCNRPSLLWPKDGLWVRTGLFLVPRPNNHTYTYFGSIKYIHRTPLSQKTKTKRPLYKILEKKERKYEVLLYNNTSARHQKNTKKLQKYVRTQINNKKLPINPSRTS